MSDTNPTSVGQYGYNEAPQWQRPIGPGRIQAPPLRVPNGNGEHMNLSGIINLLANDTRQLSTELNELIARLSPVLTGEQGPAMEHKFPPLASAVAGELGSIYVEITTMRDMIHYTLAQLDL